MLSHFLIIPAAAALVQLNPNLVPTFFMIAFFLFGFVRVHSS